MFLEEYRKAPIRLLKLSDEEFARICKEDPKAIKEELRHRLVRLVWFGFVVGFLTSVCSLGAAIVLLKLTQVF
jgi:hypothetical protein